MEDKETKLRIQEKAIELFFRHGIRAITMDEIASQMSISKKTIYQYFKDKDALVDAVIQKEIKRDEKECCECTAAAENAIHESFLALNMVQQTLNTMNPLIMYDLERCHPKAYKRLKNHKSTFMLDKEKENLLWGIEEGLYREDLNIDIVTRMRIESIFMGFNPDIFSHHKYSISLIQQQIFFLFLRGIASTKGQKLIDKYAKQHLENNLLHD